MKVQRFNTINTHSKIDVVDYEIPETPSSEFVVDDSNFIPMSEAVKQLGSNNIGTDVKNNYYDFPDGKDTGISVPITRTKDGKDIAEISSDIMNKVDDMSNKLAAEREYQKKVKAFNDSVSALKSSNNKTE